MHTILSYHGNRPINTRHLPAHYKHAHRQDW